MTTSDFMESAASLESLKEVCAKIGNATNLSKLLTDYTKSTTGAKLALVLQELSVRPNKEVKFSLVSFPSNISKPQPNAFFS